MKKIIILLLFSSMAICTKAQTADAVLSSLKTDREKADTMFSLAMKHFRKSRFDSAGYYLKNGFGYAENTGNDELIAGYLIQHSYVPFFAEKFEEGLSLLEKAKPHLAKTNSYDLHYRYLFAIGRNYENLSRNDSALYYYNQLELLNTRENPYMNWLVYYNIAQLFKRADAFNESEKYFKKAYEITKPKGIRMDHITVLVEFADLYFLLGKPAQYAALMNEQVKMMEGVKSNFSEITSHSFFLKNLQNVPLEKKVLFMENVKRELDKGGHLGKAALANIYLAGFYEEANQPATGLKYIQENKRIFEKENDVLSQYTNTQIAYRLMKKAGMDNTAVQEADKLFALKDSLISLQQRDVVLELQKKYETEKNEKEISSLNMENQLHENEIDLLNTQSRLSTFRLLRETDLKNALLTENKLKDSIVKSEQAYSVIVGRENQLKGLQLINEQKLKAAANSENTLKGNELLKEKRTRWLFTGISFLLLLSGLSAFIFYRKQKIKNNIIEKQANELQVLMKEIHHRVKNNLQVISSLLDLQSLSIDDSPASEAIKESRNRVYSMALIHQNLYSEGNIRGIEMPDYVSKLVQSLFTSYNIGKSNVMLETEIDSLLLDIDVVIPIGLVLNELISNSLKYGFRKSESGTLHIEMKKKNDELMLMVKDNGDGFPAGMNIYQTNSFGFKLIKAFAQKLKAKLDVYNDNGACVVLHIRKFGVTA